MPNTCCVFILLLGILWELRPSFADGRGMGSFKVKIHRVLTERCNRCHSAGEKAPKGGLRLDSPAGLPGGGDSGALIAPGRADESLLVDAIAHEGGAAEMPPDAKLPDHVIAAFRAWIGTGAPLPEDEVGSSPPRASIGLDERRQFWSHLPATERPLPEVSGARWPRDRVDAFILGKLEGRGMRASPETDRQTLIRSATSDLIGLSPSSAEVAAFLSDAAPHAYERLVGRMLGLPNYVEWWGRYWLDVACRAEENLTGEATNKDPRNPHAYLDWIIRALKDGLPFDEFFGRQLAVDLLPSLPRSGLAEPRFIGLAHVYQGEEDAANRDLYGHGKFANSCLLAGRHVENGVRMAQVVKGGWDHQSGIGQETREKSKEIDQLIPGLLVDLKRRSLLPDTLVIGGGEFGCTPVFKNGDGRNHDSFRFTMWTAGGGVKGGHVHGATDEFSLRAVEGRVGVHDLHANVLHPPGLDHERLTNRYSGRDWRLTNVSGEVVREIIS